LILLFRRRRKNTSNYIRMKKKMYVRINVQIEKRKRRFLFGGYNDTCISVSYYTEKEIPERIIRETLQAD
jgi:hypothetical protein